LIQPVVGWFVLVLCVLLDASTTWSGIRRLGLAREIMWGYRESVQKMGLNRGGVLWHALFRAMPGLTVIYWCEWLISWFSNRAFVMSMTFALLLAAFAMGAIGNLASVLLGEHAWIVVWGVVLLMETAFAFELLQISPYVSTSAISLDSSFFAGGLVGLLVYVAIQFRLLSRIRALFRFDRWIRVVS